MSVKIASEIKALESRISKIEAERKHLNEEIFNKQQQSKVLTQQLKQLNQKINDLKQKTQKKKDVVISEHAMLRYIERVMGIDLDKLSEKIMDESDKKMILKLGNCSFPKDDYKLVVKDGVVRTITE